VKYILLIAIGLTTGCKNYEPNPWTTIARYMMEEKKNDDRRGCEKIGRNCSGGVDQTVERRNSFIESKTQRER